jgi:hypothetical protein
VIPILSGGQQKTQRYRKHIGLSPDYGRNTQKPEGAIRVDPTNLLVLMKTDSTSTSHRYPTISQKKLTMSVMSVGSEIFRKAGVLLPYGTVENFSGELCDSV